jgi:hypothetical protein
LVVQEEYIFGGEEESNDEVVGVAANTKTTSTYLFNALMRTSPPTNTSVSWQKPLRYLLPPNPTKTVLSLW